MALKLKVLLLKYQFHASNTNFPNMSWNISNKQWNKIFAWNLILSYINSQNHIKSNIFLQCLLLNSNKLSSEIQILLIRLKNCLVSFWMKRKKLQELWMIQKGESYSKWNPLHYLRSFLFVLALANNYL